MTERPDEQVGDVVPIAAATRKRAAWLTTGKNGGIRFVPSRLASHLRSEAPVAVGGELLHRYQGGVYLPDGDRWARQRSAELLGDAWKRSYADEVVTWLRDMAPRLDEQPPADIVNCANGLVDVNTGRLAPHDSDLLTPVQIGAHFDPAATCPHIDRFLASTVDHDVVALLLEIAGYLIVPDNSLQRAFMFVGAGGNGKSVTADLLAALLGHVNVCAIPLHKLDDDRFAAASLHGKLANIFADLDSRSLRATSVFKSITGGDRIDAERKFRPPFTFRPYARLVFSANAAPPTSDSSDGFFRRWTIIPFERRFHGTQRDPHLRQKITTSAELSGLLNLALAGLADLRGRQDFQRPATVERAEDEFRVNADSVAGFLDETCTSDPKGEIAKPRLAGAYRAWCTDNGRGALGTARFNDRLRTLHPELTDATVRGIRFWRGIRLNEDTP
jgi:putative DNA primase/helicase